jgi:hypothetical protein
MCGVSNLIFSTYVYKYIFYQKEDTDEIYRRTFISRKYLFTFLYKIHRKIYEGKEVHKIIYTFYYIYLN